MNSAAYIICKELSSNDIGETGSHQSGILIPKNSEILDFFPSLDKNETNPRESLFFKDVRTGISWEFNFIYYNNKTRNEYRLTKMTRYINSKSVSAGDFIFMSKGISGDITIDIKNTGLEQNQDTPISEIAGWQIMLGL